MPPPAGFGPAVKTAPALTLQSVDLAYSPSTLVMVKMATSSADTMEFRYNLSKNLKNDS